MDLEFKSCGSRKISSSGSFRGMASRLYQVQETMEAPFAKSRLPN